MFRLFFFVFFLPFVHSFFSFCFLFCFLCRLLLRFFAFLSCPFYPRVPFVPEQCQPLEGLAPEGSELLEGGYRVREVLGFAR